ncbi:MAG: Rpn family recombination-promoting nuclease/putative transposase, partial [Ruminiclostridium sp.]|nr:Rpn family recombination-promoting nuclease/putative transposase [Ruminiclostridium sp.]
LKNLSAFLEAVLDMPRNSITKIQVLDTKLLPAQIDGKHGDLDLKVYMNDSIVNVEIQIEDERNYRDRSVYYWSKTYFD